MNPLQGISFYDAINRMVIGFLTSLWLLCFIEKIPECLTSPLLTAVYLIACFVFGLFFSLFVDWLVGNNHIGFLKYIFYKNNPDRIRSIASKYQVEIQDGDASFPDYWNKYYKVQESGLQGNVPALETISAFLLNLCGLSIINLILSLIVIPITKNCCQFMWIPVLSVFLILLCSISRNYVETKIYTNILSAYKYLDEK